MEQHSAVRAFLVICATTLLLSSLLVAPTAYSEMYIGGQVGTSVIGHSLTDVELNDFSPSGSMSDRELSRSILLGGKVGYYFTGVRWFGLETEVFYTTPHIEQQNTRITVQPGSILQGFGPVSGGTAEGVLSGDHFRVINWVPVNVMFRYHKMRLQPYVGVGMGVFFARVHTTAAGFEGSQGDITVGLNAKAGLEYHITKHLSAFGEWKYNRASFSFDSNSSGAFGFDADYHVHFVAMGLNFHF
jgi:opacity protein-like surface antigen